MKIEHKHHTDTNAHTHVHQCNYCIFHLLHIIASPEGGNNKRSGAEMLCGSIDIIAMTITIFFSHN